MGSVTPDQSVEEQWSKPFLETISSGGMVGVGVDVLVGVTVGVPVGVLVGGTGVLVGVCVAVGVFVGVLVGVSDAIHSSQQFDVGDIDFTDPAQAEEYAIEIEMPFPKHGITNCEACHVSGTNNVPTQSKSLPGLLSASDVLKGKDRTIADVPSYVTVQN